MSWWLGLIHIHAQFLTGRFTLLGKNSKLSLSLSLSFTRSFFFWLWVLVNWCVLIIGYVMMAFIQFSCWPILCRCLFANYIAMHQKNTLKKCITIRNHSVRSWIVEWVDSWVESGWPRTVGTDTFILGMAFLQPDSFLYAINEILRNHRVFGHTNNTYTRIVRNKKKTLIRHSIHWWFFPLWNLVYFWTGRSHIHQNVSVIASGHAKCTLFSFSKMLIRISGSKASKPDSQSHFRKRQISNRDSMQIDTHQNWYRTAGLWNNRWVKIACAWKLRLLFRMNYGGMDVDVLFALLMLGQMDFFFLQCSFVLFDDKKKSQFWVDSQLAKRNFFAAFQHFFYSTRIFESTVRPESKSSV